ncbi:MAG: hypothetical protein ABIQ95_12855 [Bdellovibrionia bacterium]
MKAKAQLSRLPKSNQVRGRLQKWLDQNLEIQRKLELGKMPLPVSSDIIESLFGKFKSIMARGFRSEFNRMALFIPALCGHPTNIEIMRGLEIVRQNDLLRWINSNIHTTQRSLRHEFNRDKPFVRGVVKTGQKLYKAA